MTIDIEKERSLLLQEMKVTKGSRFNAAERLRRRDRSRTTITAFASVYVIILTIIPVTFHLPDTIVNIMNIIIIVFSIVVLTSSLLQYSSGDPVRAEQHHRCALEINALWRELRTGEPSTISIIRIFSQIRRHTAKV
jgi:SMODS and SLOG-associating 2TM effector domain family 5